MDEEKELYKLHIRSIGVTGKHRGTSRDTPVIRDDNGKVGGFHREHWNGSVDATVFAPRAKKIGNTGGD